MKNITKENKTWKIDDADLPENVKRNILEKQADINVDHDWWEGSTYFPWFAQSSKVTGFDFDRGNYCQFDLSIDYRRLKATLAKEKVTDQVQAGSQSKKYHFPNTLEIPGHPLHYFKIKGYTSSYRNADTKIGLVFGEFQQSDDLIVEPTASELEKVLTEFNENLEKNDKLSKFDIKRVAGIVAKITNFVENQIDPLKELRTDHEYLTGEDAIIETLKANEYDFDEEGDIVT